MNTHLTKNTRLQFINTTALPPDENSTISKEIMLFEVPESLATIIESNLSVELKGREEEEVVLTTSNETFHVRRAETSNLLLLLSEPTDMDEQETSIAYQYKFKDPLLSKSSFIIDSGSTFYEVIPARPAFDNLSLAVYKGPDHDARQSLELIGFEELLKETRASERELKEYLFSIHCIELNEKMRKLDIEYLGYVLEFLLLTAEEQGLSLDKLDTRQLVQGLEDSGIPLPVAEHVLAFHSITGYGDVVQLDEFKTCQTLGHKILAQDLQMECQIFMQNWKKACPDTMQIDLSQLNGLYLIDEDSMHVTIQYFPKERLSSNVKVRFQELFKVRPKWNREDMLPFLLDLAPTIKELNPIILKYTRESKQGNVSFLTAKYAQF